MKTNSGGHSITSQKGGGGIVKDGGAPDMKISVRPVNRTGLIEARFDRTGHYPQFISVDTLCSQTGQ